MCNQTENKNKGHKIRLNKIKDQDKKIEILPPAHFKF